MNRKYSFGCLKSNLSVPLFYYISTATTYTLESVLFEGKYIFYAQFVRGDLICSYNGATVMSFCHTNISYCILICIFTNVFRNCALNRRIVPMFFVVFVFTHQVYTICSCDTVLFLDCHFGYFWLISMRQRKGKWYSKIVSSLLESTYRYFSQKLGQIEKKKRSETNCIQIISQYL